jgi:hypothetical protein
VRAIVLALMFFLAAAAPCSSNSYDPDPYDDMPPVVSVEFNYVVPAGIKVRQPNVQSLAWQNVSFRADAAAGFALPVPAENLLGSVAQQSAPQLVIPLRR